MPRPPKSRKVAFVPHLTYFKPAGVPLKHLKEECLGFEELEAIRLKDLEGLEQEACAKRMGISRPTFHRIISSARAKVARSLVEGKAIRIEGGNFQLTMSRLNCQQCGHTIHAGHSHGRKEPFLEGYPQNKDIPCPNCHPESENIIQGGKTPQSD